jgi:hydroxymethylbilane synthase
VSGVLRIGSRGSQLALVQSEWVCDRLRELHPGLVVEIEVIHTKGDKILDTPLAKIGDKGLFTKELEAAILDRRVDIAVHSAKDMPTATPDGLTIAAFTAREDVRDAFVARGAGAAGAGAGGSAADAPQDLADLPGGAVVGTSSLRRRSQLLAARPDLTLVDIRGNVETRLRKVEDEGMAGTVLAAAGLARLGRAGAAAFAFAFDEMLPAVGQGALAIETRADDDVVRALVAPLDHGPTTAAVRAERALMHALEGGCQVPIAALGELTVGGRETERASAVSSASLRLRAFVGSLDGTDVVRLERGGDAAAPEDLGRALATDLLAVGAGRILRGVRGETGDG